MRPEAWVFEYLSLQWNGLGRDQAKWLISTTSSFWDVDKCTAIFLYSWILAFCPDDLCQDFPIFTTSPLRWLMFLGYTIYGRQGTLRIEEEGPELDDYTIDVGLNDRYYYVAQGKATLLNQVLHWLWIGEPRLVDVRAVNDRVSDNWTQSHMSQAEFWSTIIERDKTCVETGLSARDCDASHCLPQSKGDEVCVSL